MARPAAKKTKPSPKVETTLASAIVDAPRLMDRKAAQAALSGAVRSGRKRADSYETALALDGLVALGRVMGRDVEPLARERQGLFDQLGVVEAPPIPLTAERSAVPAE